MVDYLEKIFLPYVKSKREELGLSATYPALAIFDEFNGQMTDAVFSLLEKNHIYCYHATKLHRQTSASGY